MDETPVTQSAAAPCPEQGASAEISTPVPEVSAVAPAAVRDPKGRFQRGKSGNEKGRPPGIPNSNDELKRAINKFRLPNGMTYWEAILRKSLTDTPLAIALANKTLVDATPSVPLMRIHNSNSNQQVNQETHVRIGPHLADPAVRGAVAELTQRLAARGAFASRDGHAA